MLRFHCYTFLLPDYVTKEFDGENDKKPSQTIQYHFLNTLDIFCTIQFILITNCFILFHMIIQPIQIGLHKCMVIYEPTRNEQK